MNEPETAVATRHLLALRAHPAFAHMGTDELGHLAQIFDERFFTRGAWLLRAGAPVTTAYFILEGRVVTTHADTRRHVDHGSVGMLELLARDPRGLDARAETDVLALSASASELQDLLEDNFGLLAGALRALASEHLRILAQRPPEAWLGERGRAVALAGDAPLSLAERLLVITAANRYAGSRIEAVAEIARISTEVRREAGAALWRNGERSDSMWILVSGEVDCICARGRVRASAGQELGVVEAIARAPRWYDAVAATPVRALCIPIATGFDVFEDQPDLGLDLLRAQAAILLAERALS